MRASDLMTTDVVTIDESASVGDAIELVMEHEVRHLPVLREGRLVAVISDRDLVRVDGLVALEVGDPTHQHVHEAPVRSLVGGGPVLSCKPDDHVDLLIDRFLEERVGALPVVDERGHVIGIVSTLDVLAAARGRLG